MKKILKKGKRSLSIKLSGNVVNVMNDFSYSILSAETQLPFYVVGIGSIDREYHVKRDDGYPYHQIIYTVRGEGVLRVDGEEYEIKPGYGYYLPKNVPHEYFTELDVWENHWVVFDGYGVEDVLKLMHFEQAKVFKISDLSVPEVLFKKMLYLLKSDYFYSGYQCSALLYQYLLELNRYVNLQTAAQDTNKLLQLKPVIDFIDENYGRDITLQELAKIINLSPQYLCRLFKECYDMRPFEYIARKRIQQAKNLLISENISVNEISSRVGYNDCSYFCAVFKKHEMLSPVEFRSFHKKA